MSLSSLVPHVTQVNDFSNPKEVQDVYFDEIRTLLKERLGCTRAFRTQHRQRSTKLAVPKYVSGEDVDQLHHWFTLMHPVIRSEQYTNIFFDFFKMPKAKKIPKHEKD